MGKFIKTSVAAALVLACMQSGLAGGGAGGGAKEWTQLANNGQLVAQVAKQAATVSELVASKLIQIEQLESMMRNLKKLSEGEIAQAMLPYREQYEAFRQVHSAVKDIGLAAQATRAMYEQRGIDMSKTGLDVREYVKYEMALAERRGGIYKQRMDQDLATMDSMREKASRLRDVAAKTSSITGNLEGLQHLSKLSVMSAGELMEIKAALLAQNIDKAQDRQAEQKATSTKASVADSTVNTARQRKDRDQRSGDVKLGDPKKPWNGLDPE